MPIQTAPARLRYISFLYRISKPIPYMDPVPYPIALLQDALLSRVQDDVQRNFHISHHTSHTLHLKNTPSPR